MDNDIKQAKGPANFSWCISLGAQTLTIFHPCEAAGTWPIFVQCFGAFGKLHVDLQAYSDLLRPLGYSLLNVGAVARQWHIGTSVSLACMLLNSSILHVVTTDYYNVNFVQTKYIHLFGDIPTDDMSAWRVGWYDRPERKRQKDLQKYWINHPPHWEWMKIQDDEARFDAVLEMVSQDNGPGGRITTHR
eukprot:SAG31_NODE_11191_length_1056_cov_1.291536_2_plen_188_part_01